MIDETALASGIYQALGKCLALREKYQQISKQYLNDQLTDEEYGPEVGSPFCYPADVTSLTLCVARDRKRPLL